MWNRLTQFHARRAASSLNNQSGFNIALMHLPNTGGVEGTTSIFEEWR